MYHFHGGPRVTVSWHSDVWLHCETNHNVVHFSLPIYNKDWDACGDSYLLITYTPSDRSSRGQIILVCIGNEWLVVCMTTMSHNHSQAQ